MHSVCWLACDCIVYLAVRFISPICAVAGPGVFTFCHRCASMILLRNPALIWISYRKQGLALVISEKVITKAD